MGFFWAIAMAAHALACTVPAAAVAVLGVVRLKRARRHGMLVLMAVTCALWLVAQSWLFLEPYRHLDRPAGIWTLGFHWLFHRGLIAGWLIVVLLVLWSRLVPARRRLAESLAAGVALALALLLPIGFRLTAVLDVAGVAWTY